MKPAIKITLIYLAFATLWIILSDQAIALVIHDTGLLTMVSSIKGLLYVGITSLLLFFLISKEIRDRMEVIDTLNRELRNKDELNTELNHRVRTNLQIILALAGMEKTSGRLERRIKALATVFDLVYAGNGSTRPGLWEVLEEYARQETRVLHGTADAPCCKRSFTLEQLASFMVALDMVASHAADRGQAVELTLDGTGGLVVGPLGPECTSGALWINDKRVIDHILFNLGASLVVAPDQTTAAIVF